MAILAVGTAAGALVGWLGTSYLIGLSAHQAPVRAQPTATLAPTATALPTATPVPTPIPIDGGSWTAYLGGPSRDGYAGSESQLNPQTVGRLQLAWEAHAPDRIFGQPVVVNGVVFWGSWDGYEHANDATTGRQLWTRNLGRTVDSNCEPSAVGIASTAAIVSTLLGGVPTMIVYVGGGDGFLYALNAVDGSVIWRTLLGSPPSHFLWSSPATFGGSVYMGVSSFGDCPLIQGEVVQLDGATGTVQHVFKTVPNGCVGGSVWGSIAVDSAQGLLFFGTGNPADCGQSESYAEAFVALRASDLRLVGSWQVPANQQVGDGDFGDTPTLFTATINSQQRSLVGIANKSGYYYAFDEQHVSAGPVWETQVADAGHCPECGTNTITPGGWDGVTLYALGAAAALGNGRACTATVRALDPATGQPKWIYCLTTGAALGALTVGPGFVIASAGGTVSFIGTSGGNAGKLLYHYADPHDASPWFYGPASIAHGAVYVGNSDGNLYALSLPSAATDWGTSQRSPGDGRLTSSAIQ